VTDAGRLSKLTGHDKAIVAELVRDIRRARLSVSHQCETDSRPLGQIITSGDIFSQRQRRSRAWRVSFWSCPIYVQDGRCGRSHQFLWRARLADEGQPPPQIVGQRLAQTVRQANGSKGVVVDGRDIVVIRRRRKWISVNSFDLIVVELIVDGHRFALAFCYLRSAV
jgi:hypothetical protein